MKPRTILVPAVLIVLGVGGLSVSHVFAQGGANNNPQNAPLSTTGSNNGFSGMMGTGFGPSGNPANPATRSQTGWSGMMGGGSAGDAASQNGWSGMMGGGSGGASTGANGWSGGAGSMMGQFSTQVQTISPAKADEDMKASLKNARVDKENNTITYSGHSVKIAVLGGAMDDNSSGPKEKFVIGGLINPTIRVQQGTQVTFELINEDTDMAHGIEVTSAQPPYGTMSMMQGGIYPGSFIRPIPEAGQNSYPVAMTTFTANNSGNFNYICQYPGHAAEGMYGKIIIYQ